jgi:hypothetical protein
MLLGAFSVKADVVPLDIGNKDFYSSGQILPGEQWNYVSIYNDGTIVDMSGGHIYEAVYTYNSSILNVTGGSMGYLVSLESSTANMSNGDVYTIGAWDNATVNFSGNANAANFYACNYGTLNMIGGVVQRIGATDSGVINIYGGYISDCLGVSSTSIANVYGHDLIKMPFGGSYGYGQVSGFWNNNKPFTIDLSGPDTYSRINLVPEPSTLFLLGIGCLIAVRS